QSEKNAYRSTSSANDEAAVGNSSDQSKSEQGGVNDRPKEDEPNQQAKQEEKPFVPRPLRPAASSNARQAIDRAIASVRWVEQGTYQEYHTKPEFDSPRTLTITLRPSGDGVVRLDELTRVVSRAGFPPTAVRVSRLFPGVPFGHSLPADLELDMPTGEKCQ